MQSPGPFWDLQYGPYPSSLCHGRSLDHEAGRRLAATVKIAMPLERLPYLKPACSCSEKGKSTIRSYPMPYACFRRRVCEAGRNPSKVWRLGCRRLPWRSWSEALEGAYRSFPEFALELAYIFLSRARPTASRPTPRSRRVPGSGVISVCSVVKTLINTSAAMPWTAIVERPRAPKSME